MNKEILRLALPSIIGNISVPLLSTVDVALMGSLTTAHLGALGIATTIFNFIYWNFGFLRMGTTGLTAQAYGADNRLEISSVFWRALITALSIGALLVLLSQPIYNVAIQLMNVSAGASQYLQDYFFIRILAAPASIGLYALFGWYFGMQNAIYPVFISILLNMVNIAISLYLVKYQGWGIQGVAWGTVIAQYFGFCLALILLVFKFRPYLFRVDRQNVFQWSALSKFFRINRDIFIRTLCLTFAFAFFYSQSSEGGELILASTTILLQFLSWMAFGIDGFAYASESIVGKYKGAQDSGSVRKAIRYSFYWGGALAASYSLVYWIFGRDLISIFSSDGQLVDYTSDYLIWIVLLPLTAFVCYIWDGIFIGLTATTSMRNAMVFSLTIYLGSYYILSFLTIDLRLWLSLMIFMFVRGLAQTFLYTRSGLELA